jgi:hypothetical protein
MVQRLMAAGLLAFAMAMPMQGANAQDVLGGAILGGAAGGLIGGAVGGRGGVVPGIVIGAAAGAIIANEGQRRRNGYYYHRSNCYLQRPDGAWVQVSQRYCAEPAEYRGPPPNDAVAYCMQRYRSYDPGSQTYVGYDGMRRSCP